jgi:glutathione S-transferase
MLHAMIELLGAVYSPWTERARFALDVRGVPYDFRAYAAVAGELGLRRKLGRWRGKVSVPVLTTPDGVVDDSVAIAHWANAQGSGPNLFPPGVEPWIERSNAGMEAGRGLSLERMLRDAAAAAEMVPKPLRRWLGPLAGKIGQLGIARTRRKYGTSGVTSEAHARVLDGVLDELRAGLGGRETILPAFSFADITMAQVVAYVEPPAFGLRLGRHSRSAFGADGRREKYADLVRWRDALYETYRPR